MAEWFKAHAWKACVGNTTEGSNPSLSASSSIFDFSNMKTFFIIFVTALFIAQSLFAKPPPSSLREKRLQTKTKFQIDKTVKNTNALAETILDDIKPEKTLKNNSAMERTIRADRIGHKAVLTPVPSAKKRKNTHIREWP